MRALPVGFASRDFLLRNLAKLFGNTLVEVAVGPYRLTIDLRQTFHRAMALGHYDPPLESIVSKVLKPGDVFVDVGSEIGYIACFAGTILGPAGKMILFEPETRAHARLVAHIASAGGRNTPETVINKLGCSDREAEVPLALEEISGQSRIEPGAASRAHETIRTTTLDQRLAELGRPVRLVKMDVEGHEIQALRGMAETLGRRGVDYVIVERNKGLLWQNGYTPHHLHALFAHNGYAGCTEQGEPITPANLYDDTLNNLVYAKSPDLIAALFPSLPAGEIAGGRAPIKYYNEAIDPDYPGREIRDAVVSAARGDLDGAIEQATRLTRRRPNLLNLKGHLAYWLTLAGRGAEALPIYRELHAHEPDNPEIKKAIAEIENRQ
ncbi:MAG: FkbM family methyltransferase [Candidatus Sumerlaeia bacterium]